MCTMLCCRTHKAKVYVVFKVQCCRVYRICCNVNRGVLHSSVHDPMFSCLQLSDWNRQFLLIGKEAKHWRREPPRGPLPSLGIVNKLDLSM